MIHKPGKTIYTIFTTYFLKETHTEASCPLGGGVYSYFLAMSNQVP